MNPTPPCSWSSPATPPGLEFREYQKECIAFARGKSGVLCGDEQGTGKTQESIGIVLDNPDAKKILVICPASLKLNWQRELKRWLTRPYSIARAEPDFLPGTDIVIVNYDLLDRFAERLSRQKWDIIIADECFPAGTPIRTPSGIRAIENLKPGDSVFNAVGVGVVKEVARRKAVKMIKIVTEERSIACTPNHPFFTQKGWVRACELTPMHYIKTHDQILRLMRCSVRGVQEETILRNILLCEMENGPAGNSSQSVHQGANRKMRSGYKEVLPPTPGTGAGYKRKNAIAFASEEGGSSGKIKRHAKKDRPQAKSTWGEWAWSHQARAIIDGSVSESPLELPDPDQNAEWERIPHILQGRSGISRDEVGGRGGREFAFRASEAGARSEEGKISFGVRVVRVEAIEQDGLDEYGGSNGEIEVYNLQVGGHPSYFAGGYLVHNCTHVKNPKAKRTKAFRSLTATKRLALTGTPIMSRLEEIFVILNWLDPIKFHSWYRLAARFGPNPSDEALEEFRKMLGGTMIRRLKSEVIAELPPKIYQVIEVPNASKLHHQEMDTYLAGIAKIKLLKAAVERAELSQDEQEYRRAVEALRVGKFSAFTELSRLRHETALAKLPIAIAHITDCLENGGKIVSFNHHRDCIEALHRHFSGISVMHYGGMDEDLKQASVDRFQEDPNVRLFCGSLKASGMGITLTASSHVLFLEEDWVPGVMAQACDRCHRLGQKDSVLVQHLVLEGSLDAHIAQIHTRKQVMIEKALDGATELDENLCQTVHSI